MRRYRSMDIRSTSIYLIKDVMLVQYKWVGSLFIGRHSLSMLLVTTCLLAYQYHHPNVKQMAWLLWRSHANVFRNLNSFWSCVLSLSEHGFSHVIHQHTIPQKRNTHWTHCCLFSVLDRVFITWRPQQQSLVSFRLSSTPLIDQ